ncbi:response regulator [Nitrososphaera viennensis]|mgnify:CR=1|uniref:Response regulator n=2 Tax=Nitrososphaera viennensis TaxID=1034015 RepID=A0A977IFC6_9ARCH|nr:response regulator [Nitrososphaera viennensis]AIC14758.1 putative CheY-like signal transduction response regulator, receiver domain [Nitrososphaera viennensis EN76]UVS69716.1 response regulator [Nitrososphaera viennensis]
MKILIAEDERDVLDAYRIALSAQGHEVVATENGKDCVNVYKRHYEEFAKTTGGEARMHMRSPFDAVLLDYRMPKKDGMEVAQEILALYPRQRIIFASAYVRETLLDSVNQLNRVVELLQKPFRIKALIDTLEDKEIYDGLKALNVKVDQLKSTNPSHEQVSALLEGLKKLQKGRTF